MGILRNEALPEKLPEWTPFQEVGVIVPPGGRRPDGTTYANSRYMVEVNRIERVNQPTLIWLSIKDLWRSARHDWRDFQRIKNELIGSEEEAIEIYPAESRLQDTANQFHLWCVEGLQVSLGYIERDVSDISVGGSVQRPFDHPPCDLNAVCADDESPTTGVRLGGKRKLPQSNPLEALLDMAARMKHFSNLDKVGRNERCPCGSGKKFKKCCMEKRV
jgi:hypothetical protein